MLIKELGFFFFFILSLGVPEFTVFVIALHLLKYILSIYPSFYISKFILKKL